MRSLDSALEYVFIIHAAISERTGLDLTPSEVLEVANRRAGGEPLEWDPARAADVTLRLAWFATDVRRFHGIDTATERLAEKVADEGMIAARRAAYPWHG